MKGLTIIAADLSSERFRCALSLAAAQAALGGRARLFCQGEAVALLRPPVQGIEDDAHEDAGLPTLDLLFEEALGLGVTIIACQSGMALTNTDARTLDARITFGGMVSVLQALGDDRLLCV
ncbi:peroxiredoxin [Sphingomonas solaris]|uniref:Peroxiredoxin n=2 Tax=Alterirhizorhabdus solaris TaxID=2529389 RepID=A0A558R3Y5_9SPHN|nr:DsrE family protein [Sphingomonas solaris]TVV74081.1 peroxiredoxin [Sphingomonas solaris]